MLNQSVPKGAAFVILAAASLATVSTIIKLASDELNNEMVVFLRNFFSLIALLPWLAKRRFRGLKTQCFHLHLARLAAGLIAMYCFFYAIPRLHLAEAVLLNYTAPLFIPFIGYLWLKERVDHSIRYAIILGFIGITLVLQPGFGAFSIAAPIGLLSGIFAAVAMVAIRRLSATEPVTRVVFYFSLLGSCVSSLPLIWAWQTPSPKSLALMAVAGGFAAIGQMALSRGYSLAPAAQIGPYTYSSVIFAGGYGWLLWSEQPNTTSIVGMVLVVLASGLALHTRQKKWPNNRQVNG